MDEGGSYTVVKIAHVLILIIEFPEVVSPRNGFFSNVFPPVTVEVYSSQHGPSSLVVSPTFAIARSLWQDFLCGCSRFGVGLLCA
jgi:hypothetical protein